MEVTLLVVYPPAMLRKKQCGGTSQMTTSPFRMKNTHPILYAFLLLCLLTGMLDIVPAHAEQAADRAALPPGWSGLGADPFGDGMIDGAVLAVAVEGNN